MSAPRTEPEPRPLAGAFAEGDFRALAEPLCKDPQYDERRLVTRRKLGAIAKAGVAAVAAATDGAVTLLARTSLHRPHAFNQMRVRRLWAYLARDKPAKMRLRRVLGAELAKDLDAAYRNAYLCVAIEAEALEVSLRIHADAWYDGTNLRNRVESSAGELAAWLAHLNTLEGYYLRLADWKGEWRCGALDTDRLREFLRYWVPGEHALAVERRWLAPAGDRGLALAADVPERLVAELARLAPLYRFCAWSAESDFLFKSREAR
jgi:hypothetical protein